MQCVVNWIPLRICVRSRNAQPHLKLWTDWKWTVEKGQLRDSSECSELMNTSEEMGQARDTSTRVTVNTLNYTNSPWILDSLLCQSQD